MAYVDGFVLAVPKRKVAAYRRMARTAGKVWIEHGAVQFRECQADDMKFGFGVSFLKLAKARAGETVFFSYIVFKSRRHRDAVNAKVMKDKRLAKMMESKEMPFDARRMAYGGFRPVVDL